MQTAYLPEQTEEYQIEKQKVPALLSRCGTQFEKRLDIANTIMARDWKGFGNQGMTGVIENE